LIFGENAGVDMLNTGDNVFSNFGKVVGLGDFGIEFADETRGISLSNHGAIVGANEAVLIASSYTGGTVDNFGAIEGTSVGISIHTGHNQITTIDNHAGGTIQGTNAAINEDPGSLGRLRLVNHGTVTGNIDNSNNAADVIINPGKIDGLVELGSGNCHFNGAGGSSGAIVAAGGNDHIVAGKGTLLIELGGGSSTLIRGAGHDQFFFDSPLTGQADKITNFSAARDKFVLSTAVFGGIGPVGTLTADEFHVGARAATTSQCIIYNPRNGFVSYDAHDGSPQHHFATLSPHLALTHGDFLVAA
jgi:hypothetical protein